jgi:hypothetical protein
MDNFIAQQIAEQAEMHKEEEKQKDMGPKRWTDCTYDEKHDYIEALRDLYKQYDMNEAFIDIHK